MYLTSKKQLKPGGGICIWVMMLNKMRLTPPEVHLISGTGKKIVLYISKKLSMNPPVYSTILQLDYCQEAKCTYYTYWIWIFFFKKKTLKQWTAS